jgi:flagellar hook-associated protein 3 FlgL
LLTGLPAASPPYARSYSSGASIGLKSQGSEHAFDFGIETSISGTPAAGDSFSITPSTSRDVFKTLSDLADLLESSAGATARANELSRLQLNLENALNHAISARSTVGTRLKELDGLKNGNDSLALQYSQSLSRLQDLDYAKAASEFTQQQVTLQAAQQTFVKVAALSLFNYL